MDTVTDRVTDEALSLPADERLRLVEKLLSSLNSPVSDDINCLWADEAEHRVCEIDAGKADLMPGDEVFGRIRAKQKK